MPSSTSSPTPLATDDDRAPTPRTFWLWVGVEALVAFALSMHRISDRSLWYDEGFSAIISDASWGEIARVARDVDPNMSGYHAVLHGWLDLFGTSETAIRSLSAVSVATAVFVLAALARRLRDDRTALVAGLIFAVAPLAIRYGQEARAYGLEMLLLTIATYCFVRLVDPDDSATNAGWIVVAYAATAAFACYVHVFAVLVLAAHALSLVLIPPRALKWRRLGASGALTVLLLVPLLVWFSSASKDLIEANRRPRPSDLVHVASEIAGGHVVTIVLGALVVFATALGIRLVLHSGRSRAAWAIGLPSLWLVLPFVVAYVISITVQPIFLGRYLTVCVPALALVAAMAITSLPARWLQATAVAVVVIGSLVSVHNTYDDRIQDWRSAVEVLAAQARPRDGVVVCPAEKRPPLQYYVDRMIPDEEQPIPLSPRGAWDSGLRDEGASPATRATWAEDGPDRIWVVSNFHDCDFELGDRTVALSKEFLAMRLERYDRG